MGILLNMDTEYKECALSSNYIWQKYRIAWVCKLTNEQIANHGKILYEANIQIIYAQSQMQN